jgi:hypothetical protein
MQHQERILQQLQQQQKKQHLGCLLLEALQMVVGKAQWEKSRSEVSNAGGGDVFNLQTLKDILLNLKQKEPTIIITQTP